MKISDAYVRPIHNSTHLTYRTCSSESNLEVQYVFPHISPVSTRLTVNVRITIVKHHFTTSFAPGLVSISLTLSIIIISMRPAYAWAESLALLDAQSLHKEHPARKTGNSSNGHDRFVYSTTYDNLRLFSTVHTTTCDFSTVLHAGIPLDSCSKHFHPQQQDQ